jgi:hypothetical protein
MSIPQDVSPQDASPTTPVEKTGDLKAENAALNSLNSLKRVRATSNICKMSLIN